MPAQPFHRFLAAARAAAFSLALAACASNGPPAPDAAQVRRFADAGYAVAEVGGVATSRHEWLLQGRTIPLVVSAAPGLRPLVIYLPGVGESSAAGALWREAWAGAGYAVLALQPLAADAGAWGSELARDGDFGRLGRERYGAPALRERAQWLSIVVAEAKRRGAAGEQPWAGFDWSRVALAGYETGAYTAAAIAGERIAGAAGVAGSLAIRAAIAISPFATRQDGGAARYAAITVPLLSVTSDTDSDVLGLVVDPALRAQPFENLRPGARALLMLHELPHAALSGDADALRAHPDEIPQTASRKADSEGGMRRHAPAPGAPANVGLGIEAATALDATRYAECGVAVQRISIAFLDAHLKDEARARDWLATDAAPWLGTRGGWRR